MLPWTDKSTQTTVVKLLPVFATLAVVAVAAFLYFYWR